MHSQTDGQFDGHALHCRTTHSSLPRGVLRLRKCLVGVWSGRSQVTEDELFKQSRSLQYAGHTRTDSVCDIVQVLLCGQQAATTSTITRWTPAAMSVPSSSAAAAAGAGGRVRGAGGCSTAAYGELCTPKSW